MSVIRAHFDGTVFVPDEPVNIPKDTPIRLVLLQDQNPPLNALADLAETFPEDPDWPADGASQLDHYLYGTPKHGS